MKKVIESSMDAGKQRAREEISDQVEEFLRRGGRIEVVETSSVYHRADLLKGGAGHGLDFASRLQD